MCQQKNCESGNHDRHYCKMKYEGVPDSDPQLWAEITADPQYKCGYCGGKAKKAENLCKPEEI